jgi:hypothetical protein
VKPSRLHVLQKNRFTSSRALTLSLTNTSPRVERACVLHDWRIQRAM